MSENQTPVVFTGTAAEYFGIWIMNLLLSIVTLGIYSAWAKVRRKKYFYNNTLVDGVGFDYHANPINILKGRVIAFVLFVIYSVVSGINPIFGALMGLALFLALPWIIVRGMMFNARNSSHRGLRFDFDGKYGEAALVYIGFTILIIVTLGLALPFVMRRSHKFVIDHHKFGTSNFHMNALIKDFYMIYLKLFGVIFAIGLIASLGMKSLISDNMMPHASLEPSPYVKQAAYHAPSHVDAGGFMKVADVTTTEPAVTEEQAADTAAADENMSEDNYLKGLTTAERAEYDAQIKAYENEFAKGTAKKKPENPMGKVFGPLTTMLGSMIYATIFGVILLYVLIILSMTAYIRSRLYNLIWNNTSLEHIQFSSNQRMRDLIWLYLSNAIVLLFTLGLATPWAQIRMARYRAEHMALSGETDWDKFVGEKKDASRALGEEIADMFDVDISFG
jgi:uncharacterized membrane protein YjgN (DUF898 family)